MSLLDRLLDLAVAIQQVPAPTFYEGRRAGFVRSRFEADGLQDVSLDQDNNVFARLPAADASAGAPLVVIAHLDTVFPSGTDLSLHRDPGRVTGPGIGDNALGLAALSGLVWALEERQLRLPGDLWLVADVCEEGLGDLRGMKAVLERFGEAPRAYLVLEGLALGQVYHRGLGVRRYRISVRTSGGHSWIDYGQPSAVHELTALAARLTEMKVPSKPRTTLNVGRISGGTSVNTIAAEAELELDLRSENWETLEEIAGQVEQIGNLAVKPGVEVDVRVIGERPAGELPEEHALVQTAMACLREVGLEPRLNIGSTDANLPLSRGLPAVTVGLTTGSGAHTVHEYIQTEPLAKGLEQAVRLVSRAWE
jgi:tripeptide aminopeptidase